MRLCACMCVWIEGGKATRFIPSALYCINTGVPYASLVRPLPSAPYAGSSLTLEQTNIFVTYL